MAYIVSPQKLRLAAQEAMKSYGPYKEFIDFTVRSLHILIGRHKDSRHTKHIEVIKDGGTQILRRTDRQTSRQAGYKPYRQTDRQTDILTN